MDMVNIKINGMDYSVPKDITILEAARMADIEIPTLCYLKDINEIGACRICVVEVKGAKNLVTSCVYPVADAMEIFTNTPKVQKSRQMTLELILSTHDRRCLSCSRSNNCELQSLCKELGVEDETGFEGERIKYEIDDSTPYIIRDNNKCILCRRCEAVCDKLQSVGVIGANDRGFSTNIGSLFDRKLNDVPCVACGQCIVACPTGALRERDNTDNVWAALNDPSKHVVVHTAPSVRVTLGECFGMPIGSNVKGKMVAALRRLGFAKVFDTNISADLTIVEEATELINRINQGGPLPLITSCSPGWVKFCEHYYPEFIPNISSCKSPQQMLGAVIKTWYAEKEGIDPKDIVVVSVMPCTAKKFELGREAQEASGYKDTDYSLTTRELARMIEKAGIKFDQLPDEEFDNPLGEGTGAAVIFGATGGVMEAALRTAAEYITKTKAENIEFNDVRGLEGIKEAKYKIGDLELNVAVANGLSNASKLLDSIKNGEKEYHFIEIMGCPGGCINGGGQPLHPASVRNFTDIKGLRASALYEEDKNLPLRRSHESPVVKTLYDEFFEHPGSHKAHEVLHTHYTERPKYK